MSETLINTPDVATSTTVPLDQEAKPTKRYKKRVPDAAAVDGNTGHDGTDVSATRLKTFIDAVEFAADVLDWMPSRRQWKRIRHMIACLEEAAPVAMRYSTPAPLQYGSPHTTGTPPFIPGHGYQINSGVPSHAPDASSAFPIKQATSIAELTGALNMGAPQTSAGGEYVTPFGA